MLYLFVLILLLVALAGIIAYAGDVLGTVVGRRRLSLFGWRPKRTGQIVGIAAGVLIMLTTMSTLALAFRGAATAIINAERVERELRDLRGQQGELLGNVRELEEAIAARVAELAEAQRTIREAEADRGQALAERDALQGDITELQERFSEASETFEAQRLEGEAQLEALSSMLSQAEGELEEAREEAQVARRDVLSLRDREIELRQAAQRLEGQVGSLNSRLEILLEQSESLRLANEELLVINEVLETTRDELEARVESQAQEYRVLQERAQRAESGQIAFTNDELIYSARIEAQERGDIINALSEMVRAADGVAQRRGAESISLRTEQFSRLVEAIAETPGEDFVVLLSKNNQLIGERLEVRVEAWENRQLLGRGQLLLSRSVHLGVNGAPVPQEALRAELRRLREAADRELKRLGLFEFNAASFDPMNEDNFMFTLRRLQGPVIIGVAAHQPVFVSGPAELEFIVVH